MQILLPNWPKSKTIMAMTTLKNCNLNNLSLPKDLRWLEQNHGTNLLDIDRVNLELNTMPVADGSYTQCPNIACVVKTADCLPILITNIEGNFVAALHAGWRGLAQGIIDQFCHQIIKLNVKLNQLLVWLGPAIGPENFVVGEDVKTAFSHKIYGSAFQQRSSNKYLANIYKLAIINLNLHGISGQQIFSQYYCTYSNPEIFYSYRKDPTIKRRMYSFIWIKK